MSESVGGVEREVLDRARAHVVAHRRGYYRRLVDVAELDRLGLAATTGYRATSSLLVDRDNLDADEARRLVAEAADLCPRRALAGDELPARLPCTGAALAEGAVDPGHVKVIREAMGRLERLGTLTVAEWAGAEELLARHARVLPPRMLRRLATRLVEAYDPDGAAPDDGEGAGDELFLHRRRDGSLVIKGRLGDPMDAELVVEVFEVLAARAGAEDARSKERRQADALKDLTQDARGPHGLATDTRTHTTQNPDDDTDDTADATVDGAGGEAPALIPEPRRPAESTGRVERPGRALLTVTIDHRWLCEALAGTGSYGTLDSGFTVDAATVRRWACDAEIVPIVLGSRSEPLDVGRAQRTAPDAIRRALNLRDGGCAFPGCDRPPRRCQAHHIDDWQHGGSTALEAMCLLCRYHHQLVHHGHWIITTTEGRPWFTPPWFVDPDRRPRPGGRPHVPL